MILPILIVAAVITIVYPRLWIGLAALVKAYIKIEDSVGYSTLDEQNRCDNYNSGAKDSSVILSRLGGLIDGKESRILSDRRY